MRITLAPKFERLVAREIKQGRYASPEAVVQDALRFFGKRSELIVFDRDDLRRKVDEGMDSLQMHGGEDGETVIAKLEAKLKARLRRKVA